MSSSVNQDFKRKSFTKPIPRLIIDMIISLKGNDETQSKLLDIMESFTVK